MVLRSNHGADKLGILGDVHFAKFLTLCRHPTQQVMAIFTAILYPTTFLMIQVQSSHPIHNHQGRRQGGHQQLEGGSRKSGAAGFLGMIVFWSQRKMGSNAIANKKPLARQHCLTALAMENCRLFYCKKHTQEPTYEFRQFRSLKYVEDPGMVDALG